LLYLGINQDLYDCGVAITDGERVLYCANEERYNRIKNQGGFPRHSLEASFRVTGIEPSDIDRVCVAGEMTPPLPMRMLPQLHGRLVRAKRDHKPSLTHHLTDLIVFHTPLLHTSSDSLLRHMARPLLAPVLRRTLPPALREQPVRFVEHHLAHGAVARTLSGFDEALCVTSDGMGDGLSLTVSQYRAGDVERLWSARSRESLGLFFELLTEALGFTPCRDEGKLTGLAADGDPDRVDVPSPFLLHDGRLQYRGPYGRRGVAWARQHLVDRFPRQDISAWAQRHLEAILLEVIRTWLARTRLRRLVVAGGTFGNVALNRRIHELDGVDELFVCPNMGDGGLALGSICAAGGLPVHPVDDVFWGDSFGDPEIERALDGAGVRYRRASNIEREVAALLADGQLVARFDGGMEWGPRALGNRSILARANDHAVVERLNTSLERSDFMPFAPAVLDEDAESYVVGLQHARHTAEFMTVCFECTPRMKKENPAVVHVDGTARAQLVREGTNPSFHRILAEFKQLTGCGILLNTSLNIHEEPIVRTPEEGVAVFLRARLDHLAIGDYIASRNDARTGRFHDR